MALSRADEPIKLRWIAFGALVTIGAMIVGVVFGFAGGLMHLFVLLKRQEKADSARRRRGGQ